MATTIIVDIEQHHRHPMYSGISDGLTTLRHSIQD